MHHNRFIGHTEQHMYVNKDRNDGVGCGGVRKARIVGYMHDSSLHHGPHPTSKPTQAHMRLTWDKLREEAHGILDAIRYDRVQHVRLQAATTLGLYKKTQGVSGTQWAVPVGAQPYDAPIHARGVQGTHK